MAKAVRTTEQTNQDGENPQVPLPPKPPTITEVNNDTEEDGENPKPPLPPKPPVAPVQELSWEERIVAFLQSRGSSDYVRLSDFLKSLFPLPKGNEPAAWSTQGASKQLRATLDRMKLEGTIQLKDEQYKKLGGFYYKGDDPRTQYHNLSTVSIEAKI